MMTLLIFGLEKKNQTPKEREFYEYFEFVIFVLRNNQKRSPTAGRVGRDF